MGAESANLAEGDSCDALEDKVFEMPSLNQISADLKSDEVSIVVKMSHLYALREWGGTEATSLLIQALKDKTTIDSVLFRHEAAYVLGQLGSPMAISFLEDTLADNSEDEMVRHEAAEALAAIGSEHSMTTLSGYLEDPSLPVKETCQLAVHSLKQKCQQREDEQQKERKSCFNTVDPSQPFEGCSAADVPRLFNLLIDPKEPLWTRYRALFTLRDLRVPAAATAVARALRHDETSALLRHEIAFVLGQIQFPSSERSASATLSTKTPPQPKVVQGLDSFPASTSAEAAASEAAQALVNCLENPSEHPMARHEAALALGSLGSDARAAACDCGGSSLRDVVVNALQSHRACTDKVVAESCLVALSNMQDELNTSFGV